MSRDLTQPEFRQELNHFNQCLKDCHRLYLESANIVIDCYPDLLTQSPDGFRTMMDDLHRGFLVKLFVAIADVDKVWSRSEEVMAGVLFFHLWHRQLDNESLRAAIRKVSAQAERLDWDSLVRPYRSIGPLRSKMAELETVVMRMGNIIAKADGQARSLETERLGEVQQQIFSCLHANDSQWNSGKRTESSQVRDRGAQAVTALDRVQYLQEPELEFAPKDDSLVEVIEENENVTDRPSLEESLEELQELIGMAAVKDEVNTLINFLKVQKMRRDAGLPETKISLHMVFGGNPGTGKTTVARILGKIYNAMGILEKGHLIETDRSGLVAEFAGQTAPKTNKIIDDALDGVLFIDEAYSLVSATGDDAFGMEAIQTLLKRMEDNRDRLIVILAGYPNEMDTLLQANPGLSSRVGHRIEFTDYEATEMGRIFDLMCSKNHYRICSLGQAKLIAGFKHLYENRDRHFGNGRTVRNIFENSVRKLANRIVTIEAVTTEMLTEFSHDDIDLGVPESLVDEENLQSMRFVHTCAGCGENLRLGAKWLGKKVKCKKCQHEFECNWCQPIA